jgi:hypothetical protein
VWYTPGLTWPTRGAAPQERITPATTLHYYHPPTHTTFTTAATSAEVGRSAGAAVTTGYTWPGAAPQERFTPAFT